MGRRRISRDVRACLPRCCRAAVWGAVDSLVRRRPDDLDSESVHHLPGDALRLGGGGSWFEGSGFGLAVKSSFDIHEQLLLSGQGDLQLGDLVGLRKQFRSELRRSETKQSY